ncbi:RHS repeat-associated core domain-containing protein, partial [Gemmatimonas sp.]|uniref:RHS repeat-associated core domain-containing protein n=1 Tax=Gemmatimonas sp. TaxID=1962908 RepID=UPI00286E457B
DKADATGTFFRRNRHYDPVSARFTQEDPIGIAGGLNLYGFAGGDPVNFGDPFGLCPNPMATGLGALQCILTDFVGGASNALSNVATAIGAARAAGQQRNAACMSDAMCMALSFGVGGMGGGAKGWAGLNAKTLAGKSMAEVEAMVPQAWARQTTARGGGIRYVHPTNLGEQLRVQPGNAFDPNPLKQGPYCRISQCGQTSNPISLLGNPTLPPSREE